MMGLCHPPSLLMDHVVYCTLFQGGYLKSFLSLKNEAPQRVFSPYFQEMLWYI